MDKKLLELIGKELESETGLSSRCVEFSELVFNSQCSINPSVKVSVYYWDTYRHMSPSMTGVAVVRVVKRTKQTQIVIYMGISVAAKEHLAEFLPDNMKAKN